MSIEIKEFIANFNEAWTTGNTDKLSEFLHENVIFLAPDHSTEIIGKDNCRNTIIEYNEVAVTNSFVITDHSIRKWDRSALIILDYIVEYSLKSKIYKEKGKEQWILEKKDSKWLMVHRSILGSEEL